MVMAPATSCESWVRCPAASTTAVLVGLPLTQKVPVSPATRLAPASPTRSRFSLSSSPCFWAKLRAVAALWARTTTKIDAATPASPGTCCQATLGKVIGGSPPGTAPMMATPCRSRRNTAVSTMEAATTRRAPGTRLAKVSISSSAPTPAIARRAAGTTICPECRASVVSWSMRLPLAWMPSIPGSWVSATWMPTPVRKPMRAVRDRKSARKPRRNSRATSRYPAAIRATMPARATYSLLAGLAIVTRAANMMAAVAESAPTTRWRDEPRRAKTIAGTASV